MFVDVKQPEGLVWVAKNGTWKGSPELGSGATADYTDGSTLYPHTGTGSSGGSTSTLYFNNSDWIHYDTLMSWLQ